MDVAILLESHNRLASGVRLLELDRDGATDELSSMVLHVGADAVGHVLVEATEQDRSYHDSGVVAESGQEAGALESDIGGTDDEGLARCGFLRKDIITCNTEFLVPWDAWVLRAAADGNDNLISGDSLDQTLTIVELNGVCIFKCSIRVEVLDLELDQVRLVAPVEGLDVLLHAADHSLPLMVAMLRGDGDAREFLVSSLFREDACIVHELLGDAADVDAGATEAPSRANG